MKSLLKNTRLQIMLVVMLLTWSGFYVWWVAKYQPRLDQIVELTSREQQLQTANQKARQAVANIGVDKIRQSIEAYDRQSEEVAALVPPAGQNIPLLPLITRTAERYDISVSAMEPLPVGTQSGFKTRGVSITSTGRYHDMGAFMAALLSLEYITQIHNVSVRALNEVPGGQTASSGEGGSPVQALTRARPVEAQFEFLLFQMPEETPADSAADRGAEGTGDAPSGAGGASS